MIRRALQRRIGRHPVWVWLLWAAATLALASSPIVFSDPGMWPFVFDPELLALLVIVCVRQGWFQAQVLLLSLRNTVQRVRR